MTKVTGVALGLCLAMGAGASAQTLEAGPLKLKLIGRVQAQFSSTSVDEEELLRAGVRPASPIPSTMFETRRIRFGTELEYDEWVTGKLELETGMARLQMREAWINLALSPGAQFRMGQWKKPFSLMQLTSSTKWPVIERNVRIRGLQERYTADDDEKVMTAFRGRMLFGDQHELLEQQGYQNFDLGAALRGSVGRATYEIGVFNGTGSDQADDTDGKSFAGRATYKVLDAQPLTLGAGFSTREFRLPLAATAVDITTRSGAAWEVDAELGDFRKKGLHILAELTGGRNLAVADTADHENFMGAQAVLAWYVPRDSARVEGWELAGRISYGDPRRGLAGDEGLLLTPGVNLYFTGRNRMMFNWDVFVPRGDQFSTQHALRVQAQVYF